MLEALGPEIRSAKGSFLAFRGRKKGLAGFGSIGAEKKKYKEMEIIFQPYFEDPLKPGEQGEAFLRELWMAAVKSAGGKPMKRKERRRWRRLREEGERWRKALGDRTEKRDV